MIKKILVLCTGNSCRSQMAEGFLNQFDWIEAFSAGTKPSSRVNPGAIEVMKEEGIDLSANKPEHVSVYQKDSFDYVITVCGDAKDTCPVFTGKVKSKIHMGYEDPDGRDIEFFRTIRDKIKKDFREFAIRIKD